jgi:hypothetical protein
MNRHEAGWRVGTAMARSRRNVSHFRVLAGIAGTVSGVCGGICLVAATVARRTGENLMLLQRQDLTTTVFIVGIALCAMGAGGFWWGLRPAR